MAGGGSERRAGAERNTTVPVLGTRANGKYGMSSRDMEIHLVVYSTVTQGRGGCQPSATLWAYWVDCCRCLLVCVWACRLVPGLIEIFRLVT